MSDPVVIDIEAVDARFTFDVARRHASAAATVRFRMGSEGLPVFDLRQQIGSAELDGAELDPTALAHRDLGGGEHAEMRVLDRSLPARSTHELALRYELAVPDAQDARPVGWDDGALFDFWMSDLYPGRYLEMWLPANLCHDRFALSLELAIRGGDRRYELLTNGAVESVADGVRRVGFPSHFTSLSPMLVIAPEDELDVERRAVGGIDIAVAALTFDGCDVAGSADDTARWIAGNVETYGRYVHGPRFHAYLWASTRGMEYDGATTASVGALEHEIFHSWFGRGIKPASQNDGWIDEAYTTWSTASGRSEGERFAVEALGLDEEPVTLCPGHPWNRRTPTESYRHGARLFAGIAALAGGAGQLRASMARFYATNAGGLVTTQQLEDHLAATISDKVRPLFARYVRGRH
jgi:hypothetical protein